MIKQKLSFKGRINRKEYILSLLLTVVLTLVLIPITISFNYILGQDFYLIPSFIILFVIIWFIIAQNTKREHDLGFSGWWQIIPFRIIWLIMLKGEEKDNKYGNQIID